MPQPIRQQVPLFTRMRERSMTQVGAQAGNPQQLSQSQYISTVPIVVSLLRHESVKGHSRLVHHPQRMPKARVFGSVVDKIGRAQLLDPSEPLKRPCVNYLALGLRDRDEAVNWISERSVVVLNVGSPRSVLTDKVGNPLPHLRIPAPRCQLLGSCVPHTHV